MITYKVELGSIQDFPAWSGGKQRLDAVIEKGYADELTSYIEELQEMDSETWTETAINDLLWFGLDEDPHWKHILYGHDVYVLMSEEDGETIYYVRDGNPVENIEDATRFETEEEADEERINVADVKWPNAAWNIEEYSYDESVEESTVLKDDDAPASEDDSEIKQWRMSNPLGIETIFIGTEKAAKALGAKYGITPEEVK